MSSLLRSSKFIRYCATAARSLVVNANTRCVPEAGHLPIPSNSGLLLRCLATQAPSGSNQMSSTLERSLQQLDQDVRRTGRISRKELEEVLEEIKHSKNPTSSQSLMVIRCCGSLIPEELPEVRTNLVQRIWSTMEKLKVPMDISHYNALLRVYLENEHDFSPAEFLQELEKKGVEPNRVTYQRLITRYCQQGDIEGATRILEFMREKALPVNETVFNALIMGHSQADDMDSAVGILSVMKQAGLEPSPDTYTTLLVGYAKKGEIEKIKEILAECDRSDQHLLDRDYFDIVFALATSGHAAFVDEILQRTRKSAGFNQDAVSLILRLVNKGQEEVALKVLRMMPRVQREEYDTPANQGTFLVKQLVKAQRPVESILNLCRILESEGLNNKALSIATETSLHLTNHRIAFELLKALQESGVPVRQHYFWPMFCSAGQARNDDQIIEVIREMVDVFGIHPSGETVREYIVPNLTISDKDQIVTLLKQAGVSSGATAISLIFDCLQANAINEAANVASKYRAFFSPELLRRPLNLAYLKNPSATDSYLNLVHYMYEGLDRPRLSEQESENTQSENKRDFVGSVIIDLIRAARGPVNLDPVLQGLVTRGLGISSEAADQIQGMLSGELLTNNTSELLATLSSEYLQATQAVRKRVPESAFLDDETTIKSKISQLEKHGQGASSKRSLLQMYCKIHDTDKAQALIKELGAEAGPGSYAFLIESLTTSGRLDEALEQLKNLRTAFPDAGLYPLKIVRLVEALFKQDRIEDGMRLLENEASISRKYDEIPFSLKSSAFQSLNTLAEKGVVADVERAFELFIKSNLVEVTNVMLGPLIKVHVLKNDIAAALAKLEEYVEKYKMTPWKNELTKKLIDAEDAASLQRVTDISSKVHGEVNSLYDLVFAFVECGRIRQARKILETPGLRNRQDRLNLICERYQLEGSVAALEGLIEATKDMTHIDRRDIFNQLLSSYIKSDNAEKALGVWTQMQEEDVQPSDKFLITLADFLEKKNINVPFIKPVVKAGNIKQAESEKKIDPNSSTTSLSISFKNAIKTKDWSTASAIKANLDSRKIAIPRNDLFNYLEGLCQNNELAAAGQLAIDLLKNGDSIPIRLFRYLTSKLSSEGCIENLAEIGNLIDNNMKKLVSFDNKLTGAYIGRGRAAEVLDNLCREVEAASPEDAAQLNEKFPRGAIVGIIEAHPELLPKFEQLVDKYTQLGCGYPPNTLWVTLFLTPGLEDRADEAWKKYGLSEQPRPMFQRILTKARSTLNVSLVQRLLKTLKDSKASEPAIGIVHSSAIDILVSKGEVDAALDHLKLSLNDVSLENINRSALLNLQNALATKGKEFPYTIHEKKAKASSSSSSSSDDEKEAAETSGK